MNIKTTINLHKKSYLIFRKYLDVVYEKNKKHPIIPMSLGYPLAGVFPLTTEALNKLSPIGENRMEKKRPGYGWEAGSQPLREAIINYENTRHSTHYNLSNICMTAGGSYTLNRVLEYIFQNEDRRSELIISVPTFYRMLGRAEEYSVVKNMLTKRENKFQPTLEDIKANTSSKTLAIFICNPSNPGYNYINLKELSKIIKFIERKNIYLIIDEVGDNFFHKNIFRYPPKIQSPHIIRICSASKAYQLAEFRLGYVIAGVNFIGNKVKGFIKLIGDDIGNPPLAANESWQYMLEEETKWMIKNRKNQSSEYQIITRKNETQLKYKCNLVFKYLSKSPYVSDIILPDSSFNLTFQFKSKKIKSDLTFFLKLLEVKHVSLVPCSSFGFDKTDRYLRLTFAIPNEILKEGLKRIVEFLNEIN